MKAKTKTTKKNDFLYVLLYRLIKEKAFDINDDIEEVLTITYKKKEIAFFEYERQGRKINYIYKRERFCAFSFCTSEKRTYIENEEYTKKFIDEAIEFLYRVKDTYKNCEDYYNARMELIVYCKEVKDED